MKHKILIYGGLGNVAQERIIPALNILSSRLPIEFATVDLKHSTSGTHYIYGTEPLQEYTAAIIATPNNTHAVISIKSLEAGLNILCEKPLTHTLISAQQLLLAAHKLPNLTSMQSDHYIYKPAIIRLIQNWPRYRNELGTITSIEAKIFETGLQTGREWLFSSEIAGGGIAMDTGFHMVSVMGKLFGFENLVVTGAETDRYPQAPGDAETYAGIMLSIGQTPINIQVGKWMNEIRKDIIFKGSKKTLEVNVGTGELSLGGQIEIHGDRDDCYEILLQEFLSAIEEKRPPYTTLEEGYNSLSIVKKAYKIAGLKQEEK